MIELTYCFEIGCASTAPVRLKFGGEICLKELDLASCSISSSYTYSKCQYVKWWVERYIINFYDLIGKADLDNSSWDTMPVRKKTTCLRLNFKFISHGFLIFLCPCIAGVNQYKHGFTYTKSMHSFICPYAFHIKQMPIC